VIGQWIVRGAGIAVGVALVIGLIALGFAASKVLLLVFVAVIFASGLQPVISWMRGHIPIGRGPAILLVYGFFLAVVVGMALFVLPAAIAQFVRTLDSLPPFFEKARAWAADIRPTGLARGVSSLIDGAADLLRPIGKGPSDGQVVQVGLTLAEGLTSVLTLLTVVYFWLTEHARLQRYALAFVPSHRRARARDVWNQAETRLGMWVRGQLILMSALGVATSVAYTLLGVPSAVLLGLLAALAEGIPIVGPLLGAIPAVLLAATVSPQLALEVAAVYLILQVIEGNVLVPIVMRNTVGISPFLVILSILVGAAAGGFVGALLAVPIAATAEVVLEGLQAREVPVAQDPTAADRDDDRDERQARESNAPDSPDAPVHRPPRVHRRRRVRESPGSAD
jgi:predicted PurR-regulated permease PerM